MIALTINSTKSIMGALLTSESFDNFLVEEVVINTYNSFSIDGHINKDFYTSEEISNMPDGLPAFSSWKEIKPICFSLIKGKKTPVSFRFVLLANEELIKNLCALPDVVTTQDLVKGLVLNIKYEEGKVSIVSATSYNTFIMDKSLDNAWDKYLPKYLNDLGIEFEEMN